MESRRETYQSGLIFNGPKRVRVFQIQQNIHNTT